MSGQGLVEELLERYRAAVYAKDVDAFIALYAQDARIFDMWGSWAYQGAGDWRAMVSEWFGSLGEEKVAVEFDGVQTTTADGFATVSAFVAFKGRSAAGEDLRSMDNRLTWALRKEPDGGWKIIHEHTSAPLDFETGKATLQR